MIWSFIFIFIYLTFTAKDTYYARGNTILKGLGLSYVLLACYRFAEGTGECMNSALALSQSTYMLIYDYKRNLEGDDYRNDMILVYFFAPLLGGIVAAFIGYFHDQNVHLKEEEEKEQYQAKIDASRSVDRIDVDDTRSCNSDCLTE